MPRQHCSVCLHPQHEWIDRALREGSPSMRAIAKQTGLKHAAIWRHKQHGAPTKPKVFKNIAAEIMKLRQAQTAAKKRKDTNAALAISREIRAWMALEAKAESVTTADDGAKAELPRSEALNLAMAIIESELTSPDVVLWLDQIHERVGHTVMPATPVTEVLSDE
jgi:hypothetical protein